MNITYIMHFTSIGNSINGKWFVSDHYSFYYRFDNKV